MSNKDKENCQLVSHFCVPGTLLSTSYTLSLLMMAAIQPAWCQSGSIIFPHCYGDFQHLKMFLITQLFLHFSVQILLQLQICTFNHHTVLFLGNAVMDKNNKHCPENGCSINLKMRKGDGGSANHCIFCKNCSWRHFSGT